MRYSVVIPRIKINHYCGFRKIGISRYGAFKSFAHYSAEGKFRCKTNLSCFGDPNHYNRRGECIGFSRKVNHCLVIHYEKNGKYIGFSFCILGLFWLHKGFALEKLF